ncbi:FAD-dependent oxidoreductase [Paenibacillus lutrae]|nr:FAD-dependent oxidoreductase [Paenibacillus lutrae]
MRGIHPFVLFLFMIGIGVAGLLSGCEEKSKPAVVVNPDKPDVVVIGSEIEGIYLARAAADEGLSVVILDPREKQGGQLIQGEMLYLDEPFDEKGKSLLQGRVKELFDEYKDGKIRKPEQFQAYYNSLAEGIPVESGITITDIERTNGTESGSRSIQSVTYKTKSGEMKTKTAKYWVENTDFTALTSKLGAARIPGVETVFNSPGRDYMASSIMLKFKGVDWKVFQKEVGGMSKAERESVYGGNTYVNGTFAYGLGNIGAAYKPSRDNFFLRGLNVVNMLDGEALINALLVFNVDPANPESVRQAIEQGRQESDLVVQHLRQKLPGWEKAEVNGYPEYLYIRDYDRYETQYILQASDVLSGRMHDDNVSIAGYAIDLQGTRHSPWGTSTGKPDKYGMPLRSFLLKGYSNVIVAGKNVGASAVAYGSARIQPNTSLAGEVIGIILGQIGSEKELASLTAEDMSELHAYIKKKYDIKLAGVKAVNKLEGYTEEELAKINAGSMSIKKK